MVEEDGRNILARQLREAQEALDQLTKGTRNQLSELNRSTDLAAAATDPFNVTGASRVARNTNTHRYANGSSSMKVSGGSSVHGSPASRANRATKPSPAREATILRDSHIAQQNLRKALENEVQRRLQVSKQNNGLIFELNEVREDNNRLQKELNYAYREVKRLERELATALASPSKTPQLKSSDDSSLAIEAEELRTLAASRKARIEHLLEIIKDLKKSSGSQPSTSSPPHKQQSDVSAVKITEMQKKILELRQEKEQLASDLSNMQAQLRMNASSRDPAELQQANRILELETELANLRSKDTLAGATNAFGNTELDHYRTREKELLARLEKRRNDLSKALDRLERANARIKELESGKPGIKEINEDTPYLREVMTSPESKTKVTSPPSTQSLERSNWKGRVEELEEELREKEFTIEKLMQRQVEDITATALQQANAEMDTLRDKERQEVKRLEKALEADITAGTEPEVSNDIELLRAKEKLAAQMQQFSDEKIDFETRVTEAVAKMEEREGWLQTAEEELERKLKRNMHDTLLERFEDLRNERDDLRATIDRMAKAMAGLNSKLQQMAHYTNMPGDSGADPKPVAVLVAKIDEIYQLAMLRRGGPADSKMLDADPILKLDMINELLKEYHNQIASQNAYQNAGTEKLHDGNADDMAASLRDLQAEMRHLKRIVVDRTPANNSIGMQSTETQTPQDSTKGEDRKKQQGVLVNEAAAESIRMHCEIHEMDMRTEARRLEIIDELSKLLDTDGRSGNTE
eukprot:Clim_evm2s66 gene=Clim_evmTU2s66